MTDTIETLRVASGSKPQDVAGAISGVLRHHGKVDVQVIGAASLNQAIKATCIARRYLANDHLDLVVIPDFVTVQVSGEDKTALLLRLEVRP